MTLRLGEAGTPVADTCRQLGNSQATYFRWKKTRSGLGVPELRELRQLREENRHLKGPVADLALDKTILREALRKERQGPPKPEAANPRVRPPAHGPPHELELLDHIA